MKTSSKFYQAGLHFECTFCGNCCQLPGGSVAVSEEEIENMANSLNMEVSDFIPNYCTSGTAKRTLKEQENGACIFLEDKRCTIYEQRPLQCRTFPFWPENVKSDYRWKQLPAICPGIDKGKKYSFQEIELLVKMQREYDRDRRK